MSSSLVPLDFILTVTLLLSSYVLWHYKPQPYAKPPGPKPYPIIGNLFDMPKAQDRSDEIWATWGQKWGDIVSASVFGTTVVVINSYKRAIEMLEKRGAAFSDRPFLPMPTEVIEMRDSMGLLRYGRALTSGRAMFYQELGTPQAVRAYHPELERLSRQFVKRMLNDPDKALGHCHHHAGSIILSIAYGYDVQETSPNEHDPMVKIVTQAMDNFNYATTPGAFLVNDVPFLLKLPEWLPGMGWKKLGKKWAKQYWDMVDVPFDYVKKEIANGTARDSFSSKWLAKNLPDIKEWDLKLTASAMFGAGAETTASTMYAFLVLMCMYPEIQKKAQLEIDSVVGRDRLPTLEDVKELNYLFAIWKEVIRVHPAVPNCLPHSNPLPKFHDGMFLPKGSLIFVNLWNMTHDAEVYKNPNEFDPSRFMGKEPEQDPREIIFGFGRRICPGRLLVESSACITFGMLLSAFDVTPTPGSEPVTFQRSPGIISHVQEMKLRITPRPNGPSYDM